MINKFDKLVDYALRYSISPNQDEAELSSGINLLHTDTEVSSATEDYLTHIHINNIIDLPFQTDIKVVGFIKNRYLNNNIYTWAGQALLAVHPYSEYNKYNIEENFITPSIQTLISKAWFKLSRRIGKPNQAIVISGESGSGKTYSACLAIKYIAEKNGRIGDAAGNLLWKTWSSVPLLTAFGNAPTEHNNNSSRFGKLIQLQYYEGRIIGAYLDTYLLEKCRVSTPNFGEGNFHIFRQILESLDDATLNSVHIYKYINYGIAPKSEKQMRSTFTETLRALDILEINKFTEILKVLSIILNLGNIHFEVVDEVYKVSIESSIYLRNIAQLLATNEKELGELLTTRIFVTSSHNLRRGTVYCSPCTNRDECEERKNCLMRLLYENLFLWLVKEINSRIYVSDNFNYQLLGILDVYGFEIFNTNTFEQLCINYVNERLHCYFVKDYLVDQMEELISEGFDVDYINIDEYLERVHLIDGTVSVFGIINEECLVKRFNNDIFINARMVETLKNRKYFVGLVNDFTTNFTIKHFAGEVTYDTRSMLSKNRDKVPDEMLSLLKSSKFTFISEILQIENEQTRNQTLLNKFKKSLDKLMVNLDSANVHYIKCLKPNSYQISKFFEDDYFFNQLKTNGVLDILKLSYQNYSIKLNFETFVKQYSCEAFNCLQQVLTRDIHAGRQLLYLTEKGYNAFKLYEYLKRSSAARKIQKCWKPHWNRRDKAARQIQKFFKKIINKSRVASFERFIDLSKKSSEANIQCKPDELEALATLSAYNKTLNYLKTNDVATNFEGDPISLILERILLGLKTKPFRRVLFCGSGIVSYIRLAEIPVRLHLSRTCIRNSHLLPRSELPKGLLDIF